MHGRAVVAAAARFRIVSCVVVMGGARNCLVLLLERLAAYITKAHQQFVLVLDDGIGNAAEVSVILVVDKDMEFGIAVFDVHRPIWTLNKIRPHIPAKICKELPPRYGVVLDMHNIVDIVVHVGSPQWRHGSARGAHFGISIKLCALKRLLLAVDVQRKISVVMRAVRLIGTEPDAEDNERSENETGQRNGPLGF